VWRRKDRNLSWGLFGCQMSREGIVDFSSRLFEHGTSRHVPTLRLRFLENRARWLRLPYGNRRRRRLVQ
jgi:hypothetical protein